MLSHNYCNYPTLKCERKVTLFSKYPYQQNQSINETIMRIIFFKNADLVAIKDLSVNIGQTIEGSVLIQSHIILMP